MVFLGTTFFSANNTLYPPAVVTKTFQSLKLSDGEYKKIYASKDISKSYEDWDEDWNEASIMNTKIEDKSLDAGNSGFSLSRTDVIVIKRREINSTKWTTIYTQEIKSLDDFDFTMLDTYARGGNTKFVYRISSYKDGMENSYTEEEVISAFDQLVVAYRNNVYCTPFDLDGCDTTLNFHSAVIETNNHKYPTVASNSDVTYETGSVTGTWVRLDENCVNIDLQSSLKYREEFKKFLASKKAFVLKMPDGRIWLARCINQPTDNMKNIPQLRQISFDWVEIGDSTDVKKLYYNNLSDVDESWWS